MAKKMEKISHKDIFFLILIGVVVAILAITMTLYRSQSRPAPQPNRQSTTIELVSGSKTEIPAALADLVSEKVFTSQGGKIVQSQTRTLSSGATQSILVYSSKLSLAAERDFFTNYFKLNKGSVSSGNFTEKQFTLGASIGDKTYSVFVIPNGTGSTVNVSVVAS